MSERPIGIGCMRLSTSPDVDETRAVATITAALDAGATLLDTAGAYGTDADPHANERLIARALVGRPRPTIVTKGGLARAGERFVADARGTALRAQCEASCEALGVDTIDLYLLHAVDRRTPLETSVRALDALRRAGRVRAIGLSNVSLAELDRAREIAPIDAVEVAIHLGDDAAIRGGLVARCRERGITVLAHSPLGGPRRGPKLGLDPIVRAIAERHGATPAQIAIAWLRDLAPVIVPIPGPRTPEAAREAVLAARIVLDDRDRAELDRRVPAGAWLRSGAASRRPRDDAPGEVVILMGTQGAGKSTIARELAESGYLRLNRDERGGRLRGLVPVLREALAAGETRVVLDNTYATRASRHEVIEAAWDHGVPVRCVLLDTPIEIAQANVARRMIEACGRLLEPAEIDAVAKKDPSVVPPRALFRFRRELEPPSREEGFRAIESVPFARRPWQGHEAGGAIVALDAIAPGGVIDRARIDALREQHGIVAAIGWTPGDEPRPWIDVLRTEHAIDVRTCAHPAGPPVCWCRPPLPGLGVALVIAHRLDPARTVVIGAPAVYRAIAEGIGASFDPA